MTRAKREIAKRELEIIARKAEELADLLDPKRTWGGRDEVTNAVVKDADVINSKARHAMSMIIVTERDPA